jgi:hypothetical protein
VLWSCTGTCVQHVIDHTFSQPMSFLYPILYPSIFYLSLDKHGEDTGHTALKESMAQAIPAELVWALLVFFYQQGRSQLGCVCRPLASSLEGLYLYNWAYILHCAWLATHTGLTPEIDPLTQLSVLVWSRIAFSSAFIILYRRTEEQSTMDSLAQAYML